MDDLVEKFWDISIHSLRMEGDSVGINVVRKLMNISIHSLRMEGDPAPLADRAEHHSTFQSTPSAWRETQHITNNANNAIISIHSLRMEGDYARKNLTNRNIISIHSLRMEGDCGNCKGSQQHTDISIHSLRMEGDFANASTLFPVNVFQSTPSAWRETAKLHRKAFFISPILVQSCKKGCKRLHSAPEKMVFFEKREKNLVRNLQHLSVRL